ncbi:MAG: host attachment protein [Paracoccaceae bacterium]
MSELLTHGTWVLVADGEKALFLHNLTDAEDPHLEVVRKNAQENPPSRDQGTDTPGRMPDAGSGNQRSALDETDWHRLAKERFAADLATLLYQYAHQGAFERLVIAAPDRVLGALRDKMHEEVAAKVVAEIHKDLTNHPLDRMEKILAESL